MARLKALAAEKHRRFCEGFAGRELSVVSLRGAVQGAGEWAGSTPALSDNFLKVEVRGVLAANRMLSVRVLSLAGNALLAENAGLEEAGAAASERCVAAFS